jgi:hypothetical protein
MKDAEDEAFEDIERRQGGFQAKRRMAADKDALFQKFEIEQPAQEPDALTIAYQSGYYDGKKAAQRPWVGLTDEEYDEIWRMDLNNRDIMDKTITKLKERNS